MEYLIDIKWDNEAGVWCAINNDIPLALESNSFDALIGKVKIVGYEILEINKNLTDNVRFCFVTSHWEEIA